MRKSVKVLSSSAIALSVLLSSGALAHQADAKTSSVKTVDVSKPYYYYNGYITNNAKSVLLNKNFIAAVNYDNVSINGYSVSKKRMTKDFAATGFYANDVMIDKYGKKITAITIYPANKTISMKAFLDAYAPFKLMSTDRASSDKTIMTFHFQTKAGTMFQAYFEKGYLKSFTIN